MSGFTLPSALKSRLGPRLVLGAFALTPLLLAAWGTRLRPLPLHLLVLLAVGGVAFIWTRRKLAPRRLWARPPSGWWRGPVLRAAILAFAATAYVLTCEPDSAFSLLVNRPRLWLAVMILYPLLSVLPQEILFRVCLMDILETTPTGRLRHVKLHSIGIECKAPNFLKNRQSRIFQKAAGNGKPVAIPSCNQIKSHLIATWYQAWIPILGSTLLFGWAHIIYAGYAAMFSTCLAGLALGWNYHRNRCRPGAIWPLFLEHSLYGQIIFSTGLGHYFYVLRAGI